MLAVGAAASGAAGFLVPHEGEAISRITGRLITREQFVLESTAAWFRGETVSDLDPSDCLECPTEARGAGASVCGSDGEGVSAVAFVRNSPHSPLSGFDPTTTAQKKTVIIENIHNETENI